VIPAIEDALATGHSVVIQLVSTAEALLDRRLADPRPRTAPIQLELSPRETCNVELNITYSLQSQFMSSVAAGGAGFLRFSMISLQII
jgi:hypothetical protein